MVSGINSSDTLLSSYKLGMTGTKTDKATLKTNISSMNPIQAFACLASYFAGQEENKMSKKLTEYEKAFEAYKECLNHSKKAHQGKADAAAAGGCTLSRDKKNGTKSDFDNYMNKITNGEYSKKMDKGNDGLHNKDEWQSFADVLNQEKDIRSTDLNKLSTEMDMAVKDSSEAEQMAANAIKKAVELMSTQGKTSGG